MNGNNDKDHLELGRGWRWKWPSWRATLVRFTLFAVIVAGAFTLVVLGRQAGWVGIILGTFGLVIANAWISSKSLIPPQDAKRGRFGKATGDVSDERNGVPLAWSNFPHNMPSWREGWMSYLWLGFAAIWIGAGIPFAVLLTVTGGFDGLIYLAYVSGFGMVMMWVWGAVLVAHAIWQAVRKRATQDTDA